MKENGGSVVWSPLSNLLLYGGTTDIGAARSIQACLSGDGTDGSEVARTVLRGHPSRIRFPTQRLVLLPPRSAIHATQCRFLTQFTLRHCSPLTICLLHCMSSVLAVRPEGGRKNPPESCRLIR
jgi:hypothetical protein